MNRTKVLACLLAPLLACAAFAGEPDEPTESAKVEWVGMHRDRLVELLGQPSKAKRIKAGTVLRYRFAKGRFATKLEQVSKGDDYVEVDGRIVHAQSSVVTQGETKQIGPDHTIRRIDFVIDSNGEVVSYAVTLRRSREN
jgi:hypothetical protein